MKNNLLFMIYPKYDIIVGKFLSLCVCVSVRVRACGRRQTTFYWHPLAGGPHRWKDVCVERGDGW